MANVTFTVDEETLRRARIRALEDGTSLNALVRQFLEDMVREADPSQAAGRKLVARARRLSASSGPAGRSWTRDELHDH